MKLAELLGGNALEAIRGILDDTISTAEEKREAEIKLKELEITESTERLKTLGGMLGNKSLFVAGAIPALIWVAVVSLLNNYVVLPYFPEWAQPVNLPSEYWSLLSTVIIGLFGKKIIDGNEWRWPSGQVLTPAKKEGGEILPASAPFAPPLKSDIDQRILDLEKKYLSTGGIKE